MAARSLDTWAPHVATCLGPDSFDCGDFAMTCIAASTAVKACVSRIQHMQARCAHAHAECQGGETGLDWTATYWHCPRCLLDFETGSPPWYEIRCDSDGEL